MTHFESWAISKNEYPLITFYPILFENLPKNFKKSPVYNDDILKRSIALLANEIRVSLEVNAYKIPEWLLAEKTGFLRSLITCSNHELKTNLDIPTTLGGLIVNAYHLVEIYAPAQEKTVLIPEVTNQGEIIFLTKLIEDNFKNDFVGLLFTGSSLEKEGQGFRYIADPTKDIDLRVIVKSVDESVITSLIHAQDGANKQTDVDITLETPETLARLSRIIDKPGIPNFAVAASKEAIYIPNIQLDEINLLIASVAQYWGLVNRMSSLTEDLTKQQKEKILKVKLKTPAYVAGLLNLGETESVKLSRSINQFELASKSSSQITVSLAGVRSLLRDELINYIKSKGY